MYTHTKFDHEFAHGAGPNQSFVVCSTPRCGSSLLCEALCLTGRAGAPTEFFDDQTQQGFMRHWQLVDDSEYLSTLLQKKTSPNGVFGFKAHWHQYCAAFEGKAIPNELPNLKFIFIRRRNRVRQAVSYWRAIQTNQWAATHQSTNDSPKYDFSEIASLLARIQREEKAWLEYFAANRVQPLELTYETFSGDVPAAIESCLNHLGLALPSNWTMPELTLRKQADDMSEKWVQRFTQDR